MCWMKETRRQGTELGGRAWSRPRPREPSVCQMRRACDTERPAERGWAVVVVGAAMGRRVVGRGWVSGGRKPWTSKANDVALGASRLSLFEEGVSST